MKRIKLTRGKYALVDDSDYNYLTKYKWCVILHSSGRNYAVRWTREGRKDRKMVYMHRGLCPGMESDSWDGMDTDHRDGDGLNNQRFNLRKCTRSQNLYNREAPKNNTSGTKGISWCKMTRKWRAYISFEGKYTSLGYFENLDEAIKVRHKSEQKLHGEFSRL